MFIAVTKVNLTFPKLCRNFSDTAQFEKVQTLFKNISLDIFWLFGYTLYRNMKIIFLVVPIKQKWKTFNCCNKIYFLPKIQCHNMAITESDRWKRHWLKNLSGFFISQMGRKIQILQISCMVIWIIHTSFKIKYGFNWAWL